MAIYVDKLVTWPSGSWCHMITDGALDELHAFARRLGLHQRFFQSGRRASFPHYDLRPSKRALAVSLGAVEADRREIVAVMRRVRDRAKAVA